MSRKRQTAVFDPVPAAGPAARRAAVTSLSRDYPAGHLIAEHFHDRDQLVYASRGVMTVRTGAGSWVVPTDRAVWIPAGLAHSLALSGAVAMRTLYLKPRLAARLPRSCAVLHVPPLLKELILHVCAQGPLQLGVARERRLVEVILDQLDARQTVPLQLPNPRDVRALKLASALAAEPGARRSLAAICKEAGVGKRTVERLFRDEVGMSVGRWRQQLRLMQALRLLAEGAQVTRAALEAGYSTPSAFIAMFRKSLGTTPRLYFKTP